MPPVTRVPLEHFVELGPGGEPVRTYELTRFHSLHEPGTYVLQATYSNTIAQPGHSHRACTGTLHSEPAILEGIP